MLNRLMGAKPFTEFLLDALDNREKYPQFINADNEFVLPRAAIAYGIPVEKVINKANRVGFMQLNFYRGNFTFVNGYDKETDTRVFFGVCDISDADFSYSNFEKVEFAWTIFTRVNFSHSYLHSTLFQLPSLSTADFTGAQLLHSQHIFGDRENSGWLNTSFVGANLLQASMSALFNRGEDTAPNFLLTNCNFTQAVFNGFNTKDINYVGCTFDVNNGGQYWSAASTIERGNYLNIRRAWFDNCTFKGVLMYSNMSKGVGFKNCHFRDFEWMDSTLNVVFDARSGFDQTFSNVTFYNMHGNNSYLITDNGTTNCDFNITDYLANHTVKLSDSSFGDNPTVCDSTRLSDAAIIGISAAVIGVGCLLYLMYTRIQKHRDNSFFRGLTQTASNLFKRNEPAGVTPMGDLSHVSLANERTALLA